MISTALSAMVPNWSLLKRFRRAVHVVYNLYRIVYNFTGFRCAEDCTQDHFQVCDGVLLPVCHMNKSVNQTAGQVFIKVTHPVLLVQQTLAWRPITIAINLTCPKDRLLKM